ncbi:MAG: polyamine aminopropyltransferase [Bdellovibrionaceae bacterium]|nr:polyamine aminopropyltransferase [Pseudobdellovibrionaceae bacterium]
MNALGRHILVEFNGCDADILNDVSVIEKEMVNAAKTAGATVINSSFHHFSPYGVSGVVVIQESHLAIHTWPEYGYAAVDLFTCGESVDPWVSFEHLKKSFKASGFSALEMNRGSLSLLKRSLYNPTALRHDQPVTPQMRIERNVWFTDKDENQALSLRYKGDVLFNEKTPFQQVRVFDTFAYGKMLAINNMIMCTERDESHYHEMIVHPAMQTIKNAKNILVIGGGDGGTLRELFKYPQVEKVTLVEIDEAVIRASREHLPHVSKEFSNPKLELIIGDGIAFAEKSKDAVYDLIIVDGSDPVGPAKGLFSESFYRHCHRALKAQGIVITQSESPMFHEKTFVELNQCLKKIFGTADVHTLLFHATTYPSGMWSLMMGTKGGLHPVKSFDAAQAAAFASHAKLRYYHEGMQQSALTLPGFVREMLS